MTGLFGTFNIAKRGINTSQATIDVTSHNISNSNTVGYSRQRAKIVTSRPMTGTDWVRTSRNRFTSSSYRES